MLRKSILAAAILVVLLLMAPHPASAQVRFGVTIGTPGYSHYPYTYNAYGYPVYSYPSYVYRYPVYTRYYVAPRYVYTSRRHHHDHWDRHRWR
jgi:hypothetical protein